MKLNDIDIMDDSYEIFSNFSNNITEIPIEEDPQEDEKIQQIRGKFNINPDDISKGIEGAGKLAGLFSKTEIEKSLKLECGRKPVFNGKGQKDTYNSCKSSFFSRMNAPAPNLSDRSGLGDNNEDSGMSMGAKVGIGVGVLAVLGLGVYLVMKKK